MVYVYADPILAEFKLRCTKCGKIGIHVMGGTTANLGDMIEHIPCPLCKTKTMRVIEVPANVGN